MAGAQAVSLTAQPSPQQSPAFVVRRAVHGDVLALMELKRQMAVAEQTTHLIKASAEEWARDCFGPRARFHAIVAERHGAAVGLLTFNEQAFAGWLATTVYVQDIYVMPEHRRHGIGRALLAAAAAEATRCGACLVYLNVHEANPARRLYEQAGFGVVPSCVVHSISGPTMHALAQSAAAEFSSGAA